jgi:glucose-1-phosphate adenylyltransferase
MVDCHLSGSIVGEGCSLHRCRVSDSVVGVRATIQSGARVERSVLLGADFYEDGEPPGDLPRLGVGRDVVMDRVIIDKNARIGDGARLVNEQNVEHADGDGYYIRGGIIVVPKNGVIRPGVVV